MKYSNNETLDEITIALAHEVKNPVSLIKTHIEFLELDVKFSEHYNDFCLIKQELNKISDIVSGFIQPYKQNTKLQDINITDVIRDTIREFDIYSSSNIKFNFSINCSKDYFLVNSQYLKVSMIFTNIYKNAVESIKNNGTIDTKLYLKDDKIIIDIKDDGEGLPTHTDLSDCAGIVSNKVGGSGFGICICKNILKEIGGRFEIFNNKDKGCTVRISFDNKS